MTLMDSFKRSHALAAVAQGQGELVRYLGGQLETIHAAADRPDDVRRLVGETVTEANERLAQMDDDLGRALAALPEGQEAAG